MVATGSNSSATRSRNRLFTAMFEICAEFEGAHEKEQEWYRLVRIVRLITKHIAHHVDSAIRNALALADTSRELFAEI